MKVKQGFLAVALMSGLSLAACSNTAAGAKKDAEQNADRATSAADEAKDRSAEATERARERADEAADRAKAQGREASEDTRGAARDAGGAIKGAVETIDVKSALMADRTVDAGHINVDTFHDTKTIVLKGSVKTAMQRDEAARIAATEAPGYRIDNQLRIVPNP